MKQWAILSIFSFLFLFVLGAVLYIFFIKEEQPVLYSRNLPLVSIIEYEEKEIVIKEEMTVEKLKETNFTKQQTEINREKKPPLNLGINYGFGISIDDLLQNFGIVVNN